MSAAHQNRKTIRPYLLGSLLLHGLITLLLLGYLAREGAEQPKPQSLLLADFVLPPTPVKSNRKSAPPSKPAPATPPSTLIRTLAPAPPTPTSNTPPPHRTEPTPLTSSVPTVSVTQGKASTVNETALSTPSAPPPGESSRGQSQLIDMPFGSSSGPRFSKQTLPTYPALAKRRGREGLVLLRLSISATGQLTRLELLEDPGFGFAEAAQTAIRNSSFTPALHNGKPVAVRAVLPVRFTLR